MSFLQQLYSTQQIDDAIDLLFDCVDNLLLRGDFDIVNQLIKDIEIEKLSTSLCVSVLSITLAASDKLPNRQSFFFSVEERLIAERGKEKAERILRRFRMG